MITSDRGLAGGFDGNVLRTLVQTVEKRHGSKDEYVVLVMGRKGSDFLKRRDIPVIGEVTGLPDSPEFSDIKSIVSQAVGMFAEEEYDELFLVYNEFINPVTQRPVEKRLLPLADLGEEESKSDLKALYEYEPSAEEVLSVLLPRYAETFDLQRTSGVQGERIGARMAAMGNATDNASEMIGAYTLQYNRARQAAITQELAEIVGGASALE